MKSLMLLTFFLVPALINAQVFQYTSADILSSERNKLTGQTIYSTPVKGSAIFRLDTEYYRGILFFTEDKTSLAFNDLILEGHPGIQLYKGEYQGFKLLIMIAEKDKTLSIIFEKDGIQDGFVLQNFEKKSIDSIFSKE